MEFFCIKVTLALCYVTTIYCFYLYPDDNIHTWINNIQKVNKSWMIYMTSAVHHCLQTGSTNYLTVLTSSMKCVNKFVTIATHCEKSTSYNFTRGQAEYISCPLPVKRISCFEPNSARDLRPDKWSVERLTLYHHYLTKPLKQECITAHYQQHGRTFLYLNHILFQYDKSFDRLKYIFKSNKLFGFNITFLVFLMSDMCFTSHRSPKGYFGQCVHDEGTEYIKINGQNRNMSLCMKHPLWSVYTTSITNMEYSLCKRCMNYKSFIIFDYQVLSKGVILTQNSNYEQIFYGRMSTSTVCILDAQSCVNLLNLFFIKVKKFEKIKVYKIHPSPYRLFHLDEMNLNIIRCEILDSIEIDYFYIALLLRQFHVHYRYLPNRHVHLEYNSNTIYITKEIKNISFESNIHCTLDKPCRKIYKLKSDTKSYIQVNITKLIYNGWNVPHCLYGGVSFWEKRPNEIETIFRRELKETITLCDNFSNAESKMFNQEIKNVSTHVHLKSEYLKKESKNYVVPYVSFGRETILILYHSSHGSLSVTLQLFPTPCRGVFHNFYLLEHNWKESCIIHQLGIGYLPLVSERIEYGPFYANVKLILGCSREIEFGRVHQGICQIRMDLIYIMQERNYFTLPYMEHFNNNHVQFYHKISGSYQLGCRDSPENVILRGQNYFQMSMNTSKYGSSIHKLSVNVNLVDPVIKYKRNNYEEKFTLVFRPSSKSFVSVILKSERCKTTNRTKVHTGFSLLDEKCVICLREPMQQPLKK